MMKGIRDRYYAWRFKKNMRAVCSEPLSWVGIPVVRIKRGDDGRWHRVELDDRSGDL